MARPPAKARYALRILTPKSTAPVVPASESEVSYQIVSSPWMESVLCKVPRGIAPQARKQLFPANEA